MKIISNLDAKSQPWKFCQFDKGKIDINAITVD